MRKWQTPTYDEPAEQPPADKRHPIVEMWVTAEENTEHTRSVDCPACPIHSDRREVWCAMAIKSLAHRRHRQYRSAWLAARGVDRRDQHRVWPRTAPRFAGSTKDDERTELRGKPTDRESGTQTV